LSTRGEPRWIRPSHGRVKSFRRSTLDDAGLGGVPQLRLLAGGIPHPDKGGQHRQGTRLEMARKWILQTLPTTRSSTTTSPLLEMVCFRCLMDRALPPHEKRQPHRRYDANESLSTTRWPSTSRGYLEALRPTCGWEVFDIDGLIWRCRDH
jgi:hypothetical protein